MKNLPVRHYLEIYQHRRSMAEDRVICPPPELVEQVRLLIAGLSGVEADATVLLEIEGDKARFIAVETGEVLGELDHTRKG